MPAFLKQLKRTKMVCLMRGYWFDPSPAEKSEPAVWEFMHRNIAQGWRCVDVGANRGEYTFVMAKLAGASGFVYAFELHPDNARMVQYNTIRFRDRRKVENVAVNAGLHPCVDVYPGRHHSGAEWSIVAPANETGTVEFSIPAICLDQYFDRSEKLDLVKIDVEGASGDVLAGMRDILRTSRPVLICETHSCKEWESRACLIDADYRIVTLQGQPMEQAEAFVFHYLAVPKEKSVCYAKAPSTWWPPSVHLSPHQTHNPPATPHDSHDRGRQA